MTRSESLRWSIGGGHELINSCLVPLKTHCEEGAVYLQSLPNCAAAELDKSAMFRSKEAKEFMAPYRQLYKFWTKHSGLNVTSYGDAGSLYKTLLAEKTQNLSIPQWAEDTWNELELQSNVCYHFHFRTRLLHRLRAGERSRDTR
ncbi:UNVERIFIED_CONTAM: hypothetical protein NCL1_17921 [Trichonephila clavipes]